MAHLSSIPLLAALTTLTAFSPSAHASFPAGVWGLVDEVTTIVEPGMTEPTMVRIDGLFMVAGHKPDFAQYPGYGEPQSGYMYYKCSEKELATCGGTTAASAGESSGGAETGAADDDKGCACTSAGDPARELPAALLALLGLGLLRRRRA